MSDPRETKTLFPYGNTKPLPTLGTFTADIMSIDTGATCITDFVVINGDGRSLLYREVAKELGYDLGLAMLSILSIQRLIPKKGHRAF